MIICGFPKSGNTWLTRLSAELIGCPVAGFWNQPNNREIAIEGSDRVSDYECYKAHHRLSYLEKTLESSGNGSERIIYIVRDPRDIAVSASYFFQFPPIPRKKYRVRRKLTDWYIKMFGRKRDPSRIIDGMIHGTENLAWIQVPWDKHAEEFIQAGMYVIRYEDLLSSTVKEAGKLVAYLGLERSRQEIERAVKNQSFDFKKREFLKAAEENKANFLRKGQHGQWKNELTESQIQKIEEAFHDGMVQLGYL